MMSNVTEVKPSFNPRPTLCIKQEQKDDDERTRKPLKYEDLKTMTPRILSVPSIKISERSNERLGGEVDHSQFCNPEPPKHLKFKPESSESPPRPMGNEDFRRMVMTSNARSKSFKRKAESKVSGKDCGDKSGKCKKIANFPSPFTAQPDNKLSQLARKFKSIAQQQSDSENDRATNSNDVTSASGYHSVSPYEKSTCSMPEDNRRKIQESKYFGGEMENTYLVKGLDHLLLHKTRSEIISQEIKVEESEKAIQKNKKKAKKLKEKVRFNTLLGKRIYETIFSKPLRRNEMFRQNRTFYSYNLNEEDDIPVTVIRNKAECPDVESGTLTTNDVAAANVIKIFSDLRLGDKEVRKVEKPKDVDKIQKSGVLKNPEDSIYGDIGDYVPSLEKLDSKNAEIGATNEIGKGSYFKKLEDCSAGDASSKYGSPKDVINGDNVQTAKSKSNTISKLSLTYAECYPGATENEDALADSDDDVDCHQTDLGTRRGSLGRWDFDTEEEYSAYMSGREPIPKAAFQYGVKMEDGRKTKSTGNKFRKRKLNSWKKLDTEMRLINQIIGSRKNAGILNSGPSASVIHKKPRIML